MGADAVDIEGPGVEAADKTQLLAFGITSAWRRIHQSPPPVRADVVVGLDGVGIGAHDQHRIVENVVSDVAAHFGKLFDPSRLQPDLAPQPVALGTGVLRLDVRLYGAHLRLGIFFHRIDLSAHVVHG